MPDNASVNGLPIPVEDESAIKTGSLGRATLIAIMVPILINAILLSRGTGPHESSETALLKAKWDLAARWQTAGQRPDYLILGDSSATLGIDPEQMAVELDGPVVNAAVFGSLGLWGDVWLAEQFAAAPTSMPGKAIVVVHAADVWTGDYQDGFYQYAASLPEALWQVAQRVRPVQPGSSDWFWFLHHRGLFPILEWKDQLRERWDRSDSPPNAIEIPNLPLSGRWLLPDDRANPAGILNRSQTPHNERDQADQGFDRRHEAALRRLAEIAKKQGCRLVIANGPIADVFRQRDDFDQRLTSATNRLSDFATENQHVDYVLRDWVSLDHCQMENENHPVGDTVGQFTHQLSLAVKQAIQTGAKESTKLPQP